MRDEKGSYYHAEPGNNKIRVYVRDNNGEIEFRLWAADNPEVWEKHQWISFETIERAAALYRQERNPDANPLKLYDINVAKALLKEKKD